MILQACWGIQNPPTSSSGNFLLYFSLVDRCSSAYPFAFMWGEYCCKTESEKITQSNLAECDGGHISINSVCCEEDQYEKCPHMGGCKNKKGMHICHKRKVCL